MFPSTLFWIINKKNKKYQEAIFDKKLCCVKPVIVCNKIGHNGLNSFYRRNWNL